jgi:hypothetical protein
MSDYNRPKLFDALKYGGECVVCGDEIEAGFPGWVFKGKCACPTHKAEAVIDAVGALDGPKQAGTRPSDQTSVSEALKGLDESLARIAHVLEQMYKDDYDAKTGGPK